MLHFRPTVADLILNGPFHGPFTRNSERFRTDDHTCIRETVSALLDTATTADHPGMLLGKIQSGKTKTFLAVTALAFDNGFDIAVILTKGTKALSEQTVTRVKKEFAEFVRGEQLQVFDVMALPGTLTPYELNQKLIFVAKKQPDNLDRLRGIFETKYPQLAGRRVLLIDDEADYASIGFKRTKDEGIVINRTSTQIDDLRKALSTSSFLQVTATPYSLYLQPDDLTLQGNEFRPVRPAFTQLVPVHPDYIGSDYYFDESTTPGSVAAALFEPVSSDELEILRSEDRRRFRIDECLTSPAVATLRRAICNFIVGACIRRLQDGARGLSPRKYSFLFHTEASRAAHTWQEKVVQAFNDKLTQAASGNPDLLADLFGQAYDDLKVSIQAKKHHLPTQEAVTAEALRALKEGWLMVTKVNSENQIRALLDEDGQLKLRTPLNLFIGGQILDRGVTIANLIGFFYGRRPNVFQQDTVLQHSRMFGFRPQEDLTVTRFYTEPAIHQAIKRMHESDVALRESISRNPAQPVIFIQRSGGRVVPCSPNKILVSKTVTLRAFKRILPVGFQTDYKTRVAPAVAELDALLGQYRPASEPPEPFLVPLEDAVKILTMIEPTLEMEDGYEFDWNATRAALEFMSHSTENLTERGHVWCLLRTNRNASRFVTGPRQAFYDAPDTAQREGVIARNTAISIPMLMLFRQNGLEEQGWRGTPFYWPVIYAPEKVKTAIFAEQAMA